jgi:hypothetical protein
MLFLVIVLHYLLLWGCYNAIISLIWCYIFHFCRDVMMLFLVIVIHYFAFVGMLWCFERWDKLLFHSDYWCRSHDSYCWGEWDTLSILSASVAAMCTEVLQQQQIKGYLSPSLIVMAFMCCVFSSLLLSLPSWFANRVGKKKLCNTGKMTLSSTFIK